MAKNTLPIGVFDSGVGGLTVLKALQNQLPHESFIYLGDTARLPYGTKSPETIARYAQQASEILVQRGIKLLVVACNTASTVALPLLQEQFKNIPVVGVIEAGAKAACAQSKNEHIVVIATEATIQGQAYQRAIKALVPQAKVLTQSCGLFVALAEEGWLAGKEAESIATRYLKPLFENADHPDCLVLGCTHFPVLLPAIRAVVGDKVVIVDSAQTTAELVKEILQKNNLLSESAIAKTRFLVTDAPQRFIRVAPNFLAKALKNEEVELVDII
ncbi:MAG TPA: glutamate racemase [Coxiellaceae bacterium]|nr:glutamate racemase [Coxiellaceae bacterium]